MDPIRSSKIYGGNYCDFRHILDAKLPMDYESNYSEKKEEVSKRVNELGLTQAFELVEQGWAPGVSSSNFTHDYITRLEEALLNHCKIINKVSFLYSKKDVEKAVNFLEVFLFYLGVMEYKGVFEKNHEKFVKRMSNCVELLEEVHRLNTTSIGKKIKFKPTIRRANGLMDKIIAEHLSLTDQKAYGKEIEKAVKILRSQIK